MSGQTQTFASVGQALAAPLPPAPKPPVTHHGRYAVVMGERGRYSLVLREPA